MSPIGPLSQATTLTTYRYNQSHAPLHQQDAILGHSVRALYLTTAAADLGGPFLEDAKRLLGDAVDHKMYATGGLGTEPRVSTTYNPPRKNIPPILFRQCGCHSETSARPRASPPSRTTYPNPPGKEGATPRPAPPSPP
jgi:hypothetical protein